MNPTVRLLAFVATLAACSSPARECVTQLDCFGGETCVSGSCVVVIDLSDDTGGAKDAARPNASAGPDSGEPADSGDGGPSGSDAGCVQACGGAQCGDDPVCGMPCGECGPEQSCEEGACVAARVVTQWRLDGQVVHQSTSAEAIYTAAYDNIFVGIPFYGRTIQLNLAEVSTTSSISYSCADEPMTVGPMSLLTSDNSWAALDALPDRWKGLIISGSTCLNPGDDTLSEWSLEVTTLNPSRVVGTVSIAIVGGGPRAGETLEIDSRFDLDTTTP